MKHVSRDSREETWVKLLAIPGLVLTSVIAWLLVGEASSHWNSSSDFAKFIQTNRASVAIVVQVIAQILGMIHLYSLRKYQRWQHQLSMVADRFIGTTMDLSVRDFFTRSPLSLDSVKFIDALQTSGLNWSLPLPFTIPLLVWLVVTFIPAALWAGAITPVITTRNTTRTMDIPIWSNDTYLIATEGTAPSLNNEMGFFTYYPEYRLQGLLLNAASEASSLNGNASVLGKLDKTGYNYIDRGYGVGASVGLADTAFISNAVGYTFYESGLKANVSCIYNSSLDLTIGPNESPSSWYVGIHEVTGMGNDEVIASYFESELLGIATNAPSGEVQETYFVGFVTVDDAANYGILNQAQCQVIFHPENYSIMVNTTNTGRTIQVEPLNQFSASTISNQTAHWGAKSINVVSYLAFVLGTTLRTSVFGNVFISNIDNVQQAQGKSEASNLKGISDALTSIIDNSLAALSAAQLMIQNDTESTTVQVSYPAVTFGKPIYIYSIVAINAIVCICFLGELARTRCWRRIPKFSFTDISSVIIAASGGGTGIADAAYSLHKARGSTWQADANDKMVGSLIVHQDRDLGTDAPVLKLRHIEYSEESHESLGTDEYPLQPPSLPLR